MIAHRRLLAAAGLALALVAGERAAAQDQPVEFNHGFGNQASAWVPTANYLSGRLQIEPRTPGTPWFRRFDDQAAALGNDLNAWGRTSIIGMAHSNGGLVARNYAQLNGSGSRINRLATIGTPHAGAPIAASVVNGRVVNYFGNAFGSLLYAIDFYATHDPAWNSNRVVNFATRNAFDIFGQISYFFADNSRFVGMGIGATLPATLDEIPGAPFITRLNSGSGLATESSVLARRVGMSTQVPPNGAFFRLVTTDVGTARAVQAITAAGALALYYHYREHPNWWLASRANSWLQVYWYATLLDVAWHDFIGALQSWNGYYARVLPSDAFIPGWSSQFPNAHAQYNLYLPAYNISHTEQRDHPAARNKIEEVFVNQFGVGYRPVPPPDDPPPPEECVPTPPQLQCVDHEPVRW